MREWLVVHNETKQAQSEQTWTTKQRQHANKYVVHDRTPSDTRDEGKGAGSQSEEMGIQETKRASGWWAYTDTGIYTSPTGRGEWGCDGSPEADPRDARSGLDPARVVVVQIIHFNVSHILCGAGRVRGE